MDFKSAEHICVSLTPFFLFKSRFGLKTEIITLLAAIKTTFVLVWAAVKENIEPTEQWGLTTAESSGSSIMQLPQWPLQKAL